MGACVLSVSGRHSDDIHVRPLTHRTVLLIFNLVNG